MGNVRSATPPPGPRENARQRRKRMRRDNAVLRESEAIALFAGGLKYDEIAAQMKVASSTAWELVRRGLVRRAQVEAEVVGVARELYLERLEQLFCAWMPRAVGKALDADLNPVPPSEPAARVVLAALDRFAAVHPGLLAPIKADLNVTDDRPEQSDQRVTSIMAQLLRMAEKDRVIDGHLAEVGGSRQSLTGASDERPAPPPTQPKEQVTKP